MEHYLLLEEETGIVEDEDEMEKRDMRNMAARQEADELGIEYVEEEPSEEVKKEYTPADFSTDILGVLEHKNHNLYEFLHKLMLIFPDNDILPIPTYLDQRLTKGMAERRVRKLLQVFPGKLTDDDKLFLVNNIDSYGNRDSGTGDSRKQLLVTMIEKRIEHGEGSSIDGILDHFNDIHPPGEYNDFYGLKRKSNKVRKGHKSGKKVKKSGRKGKKSGRKGKTVRK